MLKAVLWILLGLIILPVIFLAGVVFYFSFAHEEACFYENAMFVDADFLEKLNNSIKTADGHRQEKKILIVNPSRNIHTYKKGRGIIYSFKWKSANDLNVRDEETFESISIWLANIPKSGHTTVSLGDNDIVRVFVSKGSQVWVARNCSWQMQAGEIIIDSKGNNTRVSLAVTLKVTASISHYCKDKHFDKTFSMKKGILD